MSLPASFTAHRAWPVPASPWVMVQRWCDLLFMHWPLPPEAVRRLLPLTLSLDTYDGAAWIGVVPFRMENVRPRLLPAVPWLSAFPELNVRTYVTLHDRGVLKPGVYFFSLEAANPVAVALARALFKLPYFNADMQAQARGEGMDYASRRTHRAAPPAEFSARYAPAGPVYEADRHSLDSWLTDRYALYTTDRRGRPYIGEIAHPPWPLQPAQAEVRINTMAAAAGLRLPDAPPLLHFSRRIDMRTWPLRPVRATK